jgi:hypothetical protein
MKSVFLLESSSRQADTRAVVLDDREWAAVHELARLGGHPICHETVLPPVDAALLAAALKRAAGDVVKTGPTTRGSCRFTSSGRANAFDEEKVKRVIALLERGGVVVTRRQRVD